MFNESEVHLDPSQFINDEETFKVAVIAAKHAEQRRADFQRTEIPIDGYVTEQIDTLTSGSSKTFFRAVSKRQKVFASASVPWYEWISDPQVLEPCATECGMALHELADVLAFRIKPRNWQTFLWMAQAKRNQIDSSAVEKMIAYRRAQDMDAERARLSVEMAGRGIGGLDKRHATSRMLREWAAEEALKHSGTPTEIARKLLKNGIPPKVRRGTENLADPERVIRDAIVKARKLGKPVTK